MVWSFKDICLIISEHYTNMVLNWTQRTKWVLCVNTIVPVMVVWWYPWLFVATNSFNDVHHIISERYTNMALNWTKTTKWVLCVNITVPVMVVWSFKDVHHITLKLDNNIKVTGYSYAPAHMNNFIISMRQCKMAVIDELLFWRQNLRRAFTCWPYTRTIPFVKIVGQGLRVRTSSRYWKFVSYGSGCCWTNGTVETHWRCNLNSLTGIPSKHTQALNWI